MTTPGNMQAIMGIAAPIQDVVAIADLQRSIEAGGTTHAVVAWHSDRTKVIVGFRHRGDESSEIICLNREDAEGARTRPVAGIREAHSDVQTLSELAQWLMDS